jgi:tricorn protease
MVTWKLRLSFRNGTISGAEAFRFSRSREILMTRSSIVVFLALLGLASTAARGAQAGYYRFPTIHDDQIVFTCEGDLWKVSTSGGNATRLTSHPGAEVLPHLSPDGKWIAFTGDYFAAGDVYIIPSDGGEPKRLTFNPTSENVVGWMPDSQYVLFRARLRTGRDSEDILYKVSIEGGEPEQIKIGTAAYASFSKDGTKVAFNRFGWGAAWKGYRGGTAPDVWVGDLSANKFWRITEGDTSVNQWPMWIGDRVYFASERTGTANLYSCRPDGSEVKALTKHDDLDVRYPDTDGKRIVYTIAGDLWLYDVSSRDEHKLEVTLPSDRIRQQPRVEDASKTLDKYDLNENGKRLVVGSRGQMWIAPSKPGGRIVPLTQPDGVRRRSPAFSPDGNKIACITDETGEQEIALYDATGKEKAKVLTDRKKGWLFDPTWAADGKHIAYAEMTGTLLIIDVDKADAKEVDHDKNSEIREYSFSPDGKWLVYTKSEDNQLQSLHLYEVASGKTQRISAGFTSDYGAAWDPAGKYLYFLSDRSFNPYLDEMDREFITTKCTKPICMMLAKDGKSPFLPDELLDDDKKNGGEKDKDKEKDADEGNDESGEKHSGSTKPTTKDSKKELPVMKVDLDGIVARVVEFPVEADNYRNLSAAKSKVFWQVSPMRGIAERRPRGGEERGEPIHIYDLKKKKDEVFVAKASGYQLSGDTKRIAWRMGKEISIADASGKAPSEIEEKLTLSSLPLEVDSQKEWKQIFEEAWRLQRDFFWAPNMVGVDWEGVRKKYEPLLPRVATRGELNEIISLMQAELGNSHEYISGGDSAFPAPDGASIGMLGGDVEIDKDTGLHRFTHVLRPEPWETDVESPLTMSHVNVKEGDYLIAINGHDLTPADSVDQRLSNLAGLQVQLTVCSKPDKSDARDVQVETLKGSDRELRYADWCRRNREYVDQKSGGKIGYFHLPDMGGPGLVKFVKGFYPQTNKDALLIDCRDNHGGFVSQMMIERLNRKVWAYDRPRRGLIGTYPDRVHVGYKAVLINQHAGSDGDIFPDSFRTHELGPLIGMRTWGGVVGIRGDKRFIDGGSMTEPEFAWWDARRGWSLENKGVEPDIKVEYTPTDYIAGKDPQLDRGIEELMKMIQQKPVMRPEPPPFPDKSTGNGKAAAAQGN